MRLFMPYSIYENTLYGNGAGALFDFLGKIGHDREVLLSIHLYERKMDGTKRC